MSYTITVRVPDEVRDRLDEEAARVGLPPATLAAQLLADGLDDPPSLPGDGEGGDGPLVASVMAAFAGYAGPQIAVSRELCLTLARQAERGGVGAAAAAARLERVMGEVLPREKPVSDMEQLMGVLSQPVHTHCVRCRAAFDEAEGVA
ncbi:hypothetical protein AB0I85_28515 [Micromonospora echinofusca]|uniref:hypothetical protein n=1 Tax=Micromonospora echinofusca TaxID=47858 RepID=UPI0033C28CE5